ncbi:MAG: PEP-utilizing enzyme [Patescibacteria group bacterium]
MRQQIFIKSYTRDTTFFMQNMWLRTLSKVYRELFSKEKLSILVGVDYVNQGAVEIWENERVIKQIKRGLVHRSRSYPDKMMKSFKMYDVAVSKLKSIWKRRYVSLKFLPIFVKKVERLMYTNIAIAYLAEEKSAHHDVRQMAAKLRGADRFFASSDGVIRRTLKQFFPKFSPYVVCILPREVLSGQLPTLQECSARYENFVVTADDYQAVETLGEFAQHHKQFKFCHYQGVSKVVIIRGQVVFPGVVRGRVKLLRLIREVSKVRVGDVIVSPMTTPALVSAMKRAVAIVTDEGGITSHAAVVARELKKPCIIGTKIATKVLKDGNLVEVDANRGIIRLLTKK